MNSLSTSRRTLIGGALAIGAELIRLPVAGARAQPTADRRMLRSQEPGSLAVAMLDRHWEAIEEIATDYATAAAFELNVSPLGYDDLYTQLSIALTQRASTFDVVLLDDPWIPQFASFLSPLDIPSDLADAFVPVSFGLACYPAESPPCALPWLGESQFFSLRPDWVESDGQSLPETWDDTVESASAIAGQLDPDGELAAFGIRALDGHQLVESFLPILRGYGKELVDGKSNVPQLDTDEALAAMQTFLDLAALSPKESKAEGEADNSARFAAGQISMIANFWSSDLLSAQKATALPEAGPVASTSQPAQPGAAHQAMTGVWLAGIPVGSLAPDAAMDFLEWMTGESLQAQLLECGLPPVRTDVLQDKSLAERFPDLPLLLDMLEHATPRPRSPFYPQLEQLVATELQEALAGDESGDEAMKNANVALREFLVREGVLNA